MPTRPAAHPLLALLVAIGACAPAGTPSDTKRPDDAVPVDTATDTSDTADSAAPGAALLITEAMSDNHSVLADASGANPDWVELYNPGPDPVDLAGWTLSDESATATLSGTLLGGGFVVVYASGGEGTADELHAPFKLDADGETLTLARPDGTVAHTVDLPALPEDVAWGLSQDVVTTVLVADGSPVKVGADAPAGWTDPAFDDAAWADATLPIGFDRGGGSGAPTNLALGQPTTQSSAYGSYTGAPAVDGEPTTFSHTNTGDLAPWWEVALAVDTRISEIVLLNRADCCPERLYNVVITALDAEGSAVWTSDVLNPVADGGAPADPGDAFLYTLDTPVTARTVRVAKTAVGGASSTEWLSLAEVSVNGVPAAPYADTIATEVAAAPAYARAPFTVPTTPTRVTLDVAYDDGFTAFAAGEAVASANDGGSVATAAHDGDVTDAFTLDPRLFLAGDGLLALAALNAPGDDDDLLLRPTLTAHTIATGGVAYFDTPTPGEPNGTGYDGLLDAPTVSPPRGFYDAAFTATLTPPDGATLVYTTDGTAPTLENGTVVAGSASLPVVTTTLLRAVAFRDGYAPSAVVTHTWLFLDDVVRQPALPDGFPSTWDGLTEAPVTGDYEMDPEIVDPDPDAIVDALLSIPTLSIVADPADLFGPAGLYENSAERGEEWERGVSVELLLPDGGTGTTGFAETCGLRVHGYGWRYHSATKKHSFRLEFSRDYGEPKLDYPLFVDAPVDRFDSIVLRAGGSKTWLDFRDPAQAQYLHDSFARDTARDMGKLDGHATYVHLYLNGLYWGLYNPVERPEAGFGEEYLGGDSDEYDAINRRTYTNEAVDGTLDAYNALLALAEADLTDPAAYAAVEDMLDLDALIDYMLIHQYTVNRDGPCCFASNNMRGLRRRLDGEQFRFMVWDMEYSLWEATDATNVEIDVEGSISHVYSRLRANPDFRARFAERARLHLEGDGALTPENAAARYAARADEIHAALLAESARWGDTYRTVPYTRDVEWQAEYDRLMGDYFPNRTAELISQLTAVGLY